MAKAHDSIVVCTYRVKAGREISQQHCRPDAAHNPASSAKSADPAGEGAAQKADRDCYDSKEACDAGAAKEELAQAVRPVAAAWSTASMCLAVR